MSILNAYTNAWLKLVDLKKIVLLFFIFNFLFGLVIALPLRSLLTDTIGDSLIQSVGRFDYTFISDYIRTFNPGIKAILSQSKFTIALFLLLNVFLLGGLLKVVVKNNSSYNGDVFVLGCKSNFWRLLFLSTIFLVLHLIVWLILFLFLRGYLHDFSPFLIDSDKQIVLGFRVASILGVLISSLLFVIHDISKVIIVDNYKSSFSALKSGIKTFLKNPLNWFGLFLLNLIVFIIICLCYWIVKKIIVSDSNLGIMVLFLITQLFIIARIILKVVNLSAINNLYNLVGYERS